MNAETRLLSVIGAIVGSVVGAIQDMVAEQGREQAGISSYCCHNGTVVEKLVQSIIARSEDGDVCGVAQRLDEVGLSLQQTWSCEVSHKTAEEDARSINTVEDR